MRKRLFTRTHSKEKPGPGPELLLPREDRRDMVPRWSADKPGLGLGMLQQQQQQRDRREPQLPREDKEERRTWTRLTLTASGQSRVSQKCRHVYM